MPKIFLFFLAWKMVGRRQTIRIRIQFPTESISSVIILGRRASRALICRSFAHYLVDGFYHRELLDSQFYHTAASLAGGNMPRDISRDEKYASRNESSIYARAARGELLFFDRPEISHCRRFTTAFEMSSVSLFDLTTKNEKSNIPCNFRYIFSVHVHICKKIVSFFFYFTRTLNDIMYTQNRCFVPICTYIFMKTIKVSRKNVIFFCHFSV